MSTSTNRYDSPLPTADYDPWRNEFVRSHSTMKPSEQFNLRNAINAIVHKDDVVAKKEFEISKRLSIKMGRSPGTFGFHAPASALLSQRLITTGSPANGSNLIPTELLSDLFVYTLREETLVGRLGLSSIASDGADLDIPKFNTDTSAYWLADENTTITASAPVFGQLHITPKVVAGIVTVSHKLLKQSSPSVDQIMQDDLRLSVSEAVDAAVLQGTGTNGQPEGLLTNASVDEIEMPSGEDTGVSHLMDMMSTLAVNKAMRGRIRFVVNPADAVLLAQRQRFSSTDTPLLEGSLNDAMVLGIPAVVTNYCPQGTIILGDFSEMYLASYGGIEVLIDPFTDANKGAVSIRALAMVDVAVRRPESFVKLTSVV